MVAGENMMKMDLEFVNGILFCRLKGKLNKKSSYKINSYLLPVLMKYKIKYLVYNLYELDEIDESGLDAILNTKCAIRTNKGKICMCEVHGNILSSVKKLRIKRTETERTALKLIEI